MMLILSGFYFEGGKISWQLFQHPYDQTEGVTLRFRFETTGKRPQEKYLIERLSQGLKQNSVSWIRFAGRNWIVDLDRLKEDVANFSTIDWLRGKRYIVPEFEYEEQIKESSGLSDYVLLYEPSILFHILRDTKKSTFGEDSQMTEPPIEIMESLDRFEKDYPDHSKVAFIMIKYAETKPHDNIVGAIRDTLGKHGIIGVLAVCRRAMNHPDCDRMPA